MRIRKTLFACLLSFAFFSQTAAVKSDPITTIDGLHAFQLTSNGTTAEITLTIGITTSANNQAVGPFATSFANPTFVIDSATLQVTNLPLADAKTIDTGTGTPGVLSFLTASLDFDDNTLTIDGTEILQTNTNDPNFDLSPFANGGTYTITLNITPGLNFQDLVQIGVPPNQSPLLGAGSFSELAHAPVPEPASLALWGVVSLGGGGALWLRKRRKKQIVPV